MIYFKQLCNPDTGEETILFGLKDTDDYAEFKTNGELVFSPQEASDEFKSILRFINQRSQ